MTYTEWQQFAVRVREMADRINRSKRDRAFAIARAAGIGLDMCCIHNCSISDVGVGWGAEPGGRERIKAAKRASRILDDFTEYRLADRIISRAYPSRTNRTGVQ